MSSESTPNLTRLNTAARAKVTAWLTDMDGVLVHEGHAIPGAAELIKGWQDNGTPFLVLTNNSIYTPRDLAARLQQGGLDVPEDRIWTSALATAAFLKSQKPNGSAFVIGEAGMTTALHEVGYVMTDHDPDYVVLGETRNFSFENLTKAIRLILATGSVAALITKATGREPYIVGKPNPMMFRSAMNKIQAHSEHTGMIGDRMDTDVVAGIEAGLHTVLVLTGISDKAEIEKYPFRPSEILNSVADLI
jgi:NagD protein